MEMLCLFTGSFLFQLNYAIHYQLNYMSAYLIKQFGTTIIRTNSYILYSIFLDLSRKGNVMEAE